MNLRKIITAKNAGFRSKKVHVPEWDVTVVVREPLYSDLNRYIQAMKSNNDNETLSEYEKDTLNLQAEMALFATILLDDNYNLIFDQNDIADLVKHYGPIHTRLTYEAIALIEVGQKPIEEAEKK